MFNALPLLPQLLPVLLSQLLIIITRDGGDGEDGGDGGDGEDGEVDGVRKWVTKGRIIMT
jgi:hypothetical protein